MPSGVDNEQWLSSYNLFVKRIVSSRQLTFLNLVLDLSLLVASNPDSKTASLDRAFIVGMVNSGDKDKIRDIHANREFLDRSMADMAFFLKMLKVVGYPMGERIPSLASHLKMGDKYLMVNEGGDLSDARFYGQSTLCEVVEAFPDCTDEIIELKERGVVEHQMSAILGSLNFGASKPLLNGAL